jgi:hypothetical protein
VWATVVWATVRAGGADVRACEPAVLAPAADAMPAVSATALLAIRNVAIRRRMLPPLSGLPELDARVTRLEYAAHDLWSVFLPGIKVHDYSWYRRAN